MKKILLLITAIVTLLPMSAQEIALWESYKLDSIGQDSIKHISLDGRCPVLVEDIDKILYEKGTDNAEVMAVYMKDGYVLRYDGFQADIQFNKELIVPFMPCTVETSHLNNYVAKWNVSDVWKREGRYIVCISWRSLYSYGLDNKYDGICIGTTPGLTIENGEHVLLFDDEYQTDMKTYVLVGEKIDDLANEYGSIPIRLPYGYYDYAKSDWVYSGDSYSGHHVDWDANHWLKTSLEYGKTYYYRPFMKVDVLQNGGKKPMVFYGEEKSFRVPYVMEDAGYNGNPIPTEAAMMEFGSHFPDTVAVPTWDILEPLWIKWQQTEGAKQVNMSAYYGDSVVFDNGTIYTLARIPDEFYTWLAHREIVIDPYDGIAEITKTWDTSDRDSIETASPYVVTPDKSWNVPGDKYVRFVPNDATMNPGVTYRSNEVIPGVRYKLQLNFAPETEIENTEATANDFLPTKVQVYSVIGYERTRINLPTDVKNVTEIPATEVTTIEVENFSTQTMGLNLKIETRVTNVEARKGTHNRIMRIAEIRLVPEE